MLGKTTATPSTSIQATARTADVVGHTAVRLYLQGVPGKKDPFLLQGVLKTNSTTTSTSKGVTQIQVRQFSISADAQKQLVPDSDAKHVGFIELVWIRFGLPFKIAS
eukprot:5272274-Amphidinium_carterae.1